LKFVPAVSVIYDKRIDENIALYKEILNKPFDFGVDESIIVDDVGYSPSPMFERAGVFASSAPIFSSDQDISVNVNVIFLIADR